MLQPEGVRRELLSGGRLDPQGLYGRVAGPHCGATPASSWLCCAVVGSEKIRVELKNRLPATRVPNTAVDRLLTINGELMLGKRCPLWPVPVTAGVCCLR